MVRIIIVLAFLVTSLGAYANGGSIALDNLISHKEKEIHQTRKARGEEVNSELNRLFDDMIRTQEKDLKRMTDLRSKLFPGKNVSEADDKYLSDEIARELRKVEKELYDVAKRFRSRLENKQAQEDAGLRVEVAETSKAYEVKAEIPGVPRENIKVGLNENTISIKAKRQEEVTTKDSTTTKSEFHYGEFERVIELPKKVNAKSMKVEYQDGILRIHLNKV